MLQMLSAEAENERGLLLGWQVAQRYLSRVLIRKWGDCNGCSAIRGVGIDAALRGEKVSNTNRQSKINGFRSIW